MGFDSSATDSSFFWELEMGFDPWVTDSFVSLVVVMDFDLVSKIVGDFGVVEVIVMGKEILSVTRSEIEIVRMSVRKTGTGSLKGRAAFW
tara:strand:+ start:1043 stop:1312 length:270 start_codon:yes stop_codon:yes gene_type:complete